MIQLIKKLEDDASLSKQQIAKTIEIIKEFNNAHQGNVNWNELSEILTNTVPESNKTSNFTEAYY